ncbi:MAG: hypothetical protein RSA29_14680 [Clostridium sp.]|uniref:hypothetical protein n=1 Tax=Clostridium sp. TaxID=1506 RepID=UPI00321753BE
MLKLGKMNAKSIANGMLTIGLIYVAIRLLGILNQWILVPGTPVTSPKVNFNYIMYWINTLTKPILGIWLFKLVCECLYKILRLVEIMINKNMKLSDE